MMPCASVAVLPSWELAFAVSKPVMVAVPVAVRLDVTILPPSVLIPPPPERMAPPSESITPPPVITCPVCVLTSPPPVLTLLPAVSTPPVADSNPVMVATPFTTNASAVTVPTTSSAVLGVLAG